MKRLIGTGLFTALCIGTALHAAPTYFDNEETFVNTVQPTSFVDFNDTQEASFIGQPASVSNMTFLGPMHPDYPNLEFQVNYIGVSWHPVLSVNGTKEVNGLSSDAHSMRIDFLAPISSFGATFRNWLYMDETAKFNLLGPEDNTLATLSLEDNNSDVIFRGVDLGNSLATAIEFDVTNSERGDPPPLKWSSAMFRKTEGTHGQQATQTRRDCHEVTAG